MAITKLDDILKQIISWEKSLNKFYTMIRCKLKNERSRKIIEILKEEQADFFQTLKKLDIRNYAKSEFIKNPPDWRSEEIIPRVDVPEDASPSQILDLVLGFEEKLEQYYQHVRDILVYKKDQELMDSLIQLKLNQLKRIKGFIDNYSLVI